MPVIIIQSNDLAQALESESVKIHQIYSEVPLKVDNCICGRDDIEVYKIEGMQHAVNCMLTHIAYENVRTKVFPTNETE